MMTALTPTQIDLVLSLISATAPINAVNWEVQIGAVFEDATSFNDG